MGQNIFIVSLVWQIITQVNNYENGHLAADHEVGPDARSVFSEGGSAMKKILPAKLVVSAEIKAKPEKSMQVILPADTLASEPEASAGTFSSSELRGQTAAYRATQAAITMPLIGHARPQGWNLAGSAVQKHKQKFFRRIVIKFSNTSLGRR